jgi:hypothetical protein
MESLPLPRHVLEAHARFEPWAMGIREPTTVIDELRDTHGIDQREHAARV